MVFLGVPFHYEILFGEGTICEIVEAVGVGLDRPPDEHRHPVYPVSRGILILTADFILGCQTGHNLLEDESILFKLLPPVLRADFAKLDIPQLRLPRRPFDDVFNLMAVVASHHDSDPDTGAFRLRQNLLPIKQGGHPHDFFIGCPIEAVDAVADAATGIYRIELVQSEDSVGPNTHPAHPRLAAEEGDELVHVLVSQSVRGLPRDVDAVYPGVLSAGESVGESFPVIEVNVELVVMEVFLSKVPTEAEVAIGITGPKEIDVQERGLASLAVLVS